MALITTLRLLSTDVAGDTPFGDWYLRGARDEMTDEVHRHVFTLNSRESLASWTGDSFVDTSLALAFHHVMEGLAVIPRLEQVHYFNGSPRSIEIRHR